MKKEEIESVIASYKAKGAEIDKVEVVVSDKDIAVGYLIKPNRLVISPMIAHITTDPVKAAEIWIESCLIREISDSRFLTEDAFIYSVMPLVNNLVELKKTTLTSV